MEVPGESLVLAKTLPTKLCFDHVTQGSLTLRSVYSSGAPGEIVYVEGRDYRVDYAHGTIARTPDSRIPDYSTHALYGLIDFDHNKFPNLATNHAWFVWANYRTTNGQPWAAPNDQSRHLVTTRQKLVAGGAFLLATYGDSITAGGEASEEKFRFTHRFADHLKVKFPKARIALQDASIPGYTSQQGVEWFDQKIGTAERPNLVLVGFGMNDHNIPGYGTDLATFQANLVKIVTLIRERHGAEVILFSAFPPHEDWHFGSHRMGEYARATQQAADDTQSAFVDVYGTWSMVLQRKDQSSLLGNNINHPNDFGHWLYTQAFEAMHLGVF